jgi:hypothetical protein
VVDFVAGCPSVAHTATVHYLLLLLFVFIALRLARILEVIARQVDSTSIE